jgi:hypothetical protein
MVNKDKKSILKLTGIWGRWVNIEMDTCNGQSETNKRLDTCIYLLIDFFVLH